MRFAATAQHPLVSVITPAYNAAATLERACRSLRNLDFIAWEHIIVNDGSTDATRTLAEKRAAADARVKVITTVNGGNGAANNAGLRLASAPLIAFLDADDEYLPGHLSKRLQFLNEHPEIDAIGGGLEVIADEERDAWVPDMEKGHGLIHASKCIVQGTIVLRRRVIERFRFTEDRAVWYTDYDFMKRVSTVFAIARFPEVTYRYYRNSGASIVDRVKARLGV
ncbi:MAG: glycosyltransferase family 2 protein [Acidobacteriota bacterium]